MKELKGIYGKKSKSKKKQRVVEDQIADMLDITSEPSDLEVMSDEDLKIENLSNRQEEIEKLVTKRSEYGVQNDLTNIDKLLDLFFLKLFSEKI